MAPIPRDRLRTPKLEDPDPYLAGASFLAWLSKVGHDASLSDCENKWAQHKKNFHTKELEDCCLEDYIKYIGCDLIMKDRCSRRRRCGEIVKLTPKGVAWAAEWALHYNVYRGHHAGPNLNMY